MRRQTVVAGRAATGSGQHFRLDPFALPVCHSAIGEMTAFTLDRDQAVVRRPVAGRLASLSVPVRAYAGVSVRIEPAGQAGAISVIVELRHKDPRLTLPLVVADEPEDAAADWIAWGRALNLPLLVVQHDGTIRVPVERLGGLVIWSPRPRRNRALFRGRRSRQIRRRKPGRSQGLDRLAGREIIARD